MGAAHGHVEGQESESEPVILHCYDYFTSGEGQLLNDILRKFDTGAFHCGVEVYGKEWSYGGMARDGSSSGIFYVTPKTAPGSYRETVNMGYTRMSEDAFKKELVKLMKDWPANQYNLLKKNCCHFSNELCQTLGVGSTPDWTMRLASTGASLKAGVGATEPPSEPMPAGRPSGWPSRPMAIGYEKLQAHEHGSQPSASFKGAVIILLGLTLALMGCCLVSLARRGNDDQAEGRGNLRPGTPYNCAEGFHDWRGTWTMAKKTWCCQYHDRGCPFDCITDMAHWKAKWSPAQQAWCCHHSGFGCRISDTAAATATTAAPSAAATALVLGSNQTAGAVSTVSPAYIATPSTPAVAKSPFGSFVSTSTLPLVLGGEETMDGSQALPAAHPIIGYPGSSAGLEEAGSTTYWDDGSIITTQMSQPIPYPSTTFWDDYSNDMSAASSKARTVPSTTFWDDRDHKAGAMPSTTFWDDGANVVLGGSADALPSTSFWDDHANIGMQGATGGAASTSGAPHTTPFWDDHSIDDISSSGSIKGAATHSSTGTKSNGSKQPVGSGSEGESSASTSAVPAVPPPPAGVPPHPAGGKKPKPPWADLAEEEDDDDHV